MPRSQMGKHWMPFTKTCTRRALYAPSPTEQLCPLGVRTLHLGVASADTTHNDASWELAQPANNKKNLLFTGEKAVGTETFYLVQVIPETAGAAKNSFVG